MRRNRPLLRGADGVGRWLPAARLRRALPRRMGRARSRPDRVWRPSCRGLPRLLGRVGSVRCNSAAAIASRAACVSATSADVSALVGVGLGELAVATSRSADFGPELARPPRASPHAPGFARRFAFGCRVGRLPRVVPPPTLPASTGPGVRDRSIGERSGRSRLGCASDLRPRSRLGMRRSTSGAGERLWLGSGGLGGSGSIGTPASGRRSRRTPAASTVLRLDVRRRSAFGAGSSEDHGSGHRLGRASRRLHGRSDSYARSVDAGRGRLLLPSRQAFRSLEDRLRGRRSLDRRGFAFGGVLGVGRARTRQRHRRRLRHGAVVHRRRPRRPRFRPRPFDLGREVRRPARLRRARPSRRRQRRRRPSPPPRTVRRGVDRPPDRSMRRPDGMAWCGSWRVCVGSRAAAAAAAAAAASRPSCASLAAAARPGRGSSSGRAESGRGPPSDRAGARGAGPAPRPRQRLPRRRTSLPSRSPAACLSPPSSPPSWRRTPPAQRLEPLGAAKVMSRRARAPRPAPRLASRA